MAATFGKIEEFDREKEAWSQYVERLGYFFKANKIDDGDRKRAVFLSVIGATTYRMLRSLVAPAKPGEKPFPDLMTVLSGHFSPKPSEIVQWFKFHTRTRKPGESIAKFVEELRALAEFCNFGDTLEKMLRDRLVCGVNNDDIQRRLLAEKGLSIRKLWSLQSVWKLQSRMLSYWALHHSGSLLVQFWLQKRYIK